MAAFCFMQCFPCTGHTKIVKIGFYETDNNIINNQITVWADFLLYFRRAKP